MKKKLGVAHVLLTCMVGTLVGLPTVVFGSNLSESVATIVGFDRPDNNGKRKRVGNRENRIFADESKFESFCLDVGNVTSSASDVVVASVGQLSANHFFNFSPARESDITVSLTIDDPSVATFGDTSSDSLVLNVPAGVTRTPTYDVKARKIGAAKITATFSDTGSTEMLDVVTWDLVRVVDYNAGGSTAGACYEPTNVPSMLLATEDKANCGASVFQRIAADGASMLSFQIAAGGTGKACFTITDDGDATNGLLIEDAGELFVGGIAGTPADVVSTDSTEYLNKHWAFGTYAVADGLFMHSNERIVKIGVGFNPPQSNGNYNTNVTSTIETEITVARPPIVLVHGVFSSAIMWETVLDNWPGESRLKPFDYESTHDFPFMSNALLLRKKIRGEIFKSKFRDGGTVISRVNVIAHSMGGVISRTLMDLPDYRVNTNLEKGIINRIATLGTPHDGSIQSNMSVFMHSQLGHTKIVTVVDHETGVPTQVEIPTIVVQIDSVMPGDAHYGAICDLAENSEAVEFGAVVDVRGHAISGSGGSQTDFESPTNVARLFFDASEEVFLLDPYVYRIPNDGIVSQLSASGGLGPEATVDYAQLFHSVTYDKSKVLYLDTELINRLSADFDDTSKWEALTGLPNSTYRDLGLPLGVPYDGGQPFDVPSGTYPDGLAYIEGCISPGTMFNPPTIP